MLLSFIELYNNGYSTKIKVVLIILLCFIMGFRYNVGNDYHNYVDIYENLDWYMGKNRHNINYVIDKIRINLTNF